MIANSLVDDIYSVIKRPLKIATETALDAVLTSTGIGSLAVPVVNSLVDVAFDALENQIIKTAKTVNIDDNSSVQPKLSTSTITSSLYATPLSDNDDTSMSVQMGAGLGIKYKCMTFTMPYYTWGYSKPYNAPVSSPNR